MVSSTPSSMRFEDLSPGARTDCEWIECDRWRATLGLYVYLLCSVDVQIRESSLGNLVMIEAAQQCDEKDGSHTTGNDRDQVRPVNFAGRCRQARLRPMGQCPVWRFGEMGN